MYLGRMRAILSKNSRKCFVYFKLIDNDLQNSGKPGRSVTGISAL